MLDEKIELTPQDIYSKEFKFDTKGYRAQDVDAFLDVVIRDYTVYATQIKNKDKLIKELHAEVYRLKEDIRKLQNINETSSANDKNSVNNVDLLRRISQLEKIVYSKFDSE